MATGPTRRREEQRVRDRARARLHDGPAAVRRRDGRQARDERGAADGHREDGDQPQDPAADVVAQRGARVRARARRRPAPGRAAAPAAPPPKASITPPAHAIAAEARSAGTPRAAAARHEAPRWSPRCPRGRSPRAPSRPAHRARRARLPGRRGRPSARAGTACHDQPDHRAGRSASRRAITGRQSAMSVPGRTGAEPLATHPADPRGRGVRGRARRVGRPRRRAAGLARRGRWRSSWRWSRSRRERPRRACWAWDRGRGGLASSAASRRTRASTRAARSGPWRARSPRRWRVARIPADGGIVRPVRTVRRGRGRSCWRRLVGRARGAPGAGARATGVDGGAPARLGHRRRRS